MSVEILDSKKYRRLLSGGLKRLEEKCDQINKLNVFPVPDGDTGDNMLLTLQSGLAENVSEDDLNLQCEAMSKGMLYGARGNSGVILSRFFYGINCGISEFGSTITVEDSLAAFERGVKEAYDAVSDPKEGTILTVMSETAEAMRSSGSDDFSELFDTAIETARESLNKTPEKLEVLRDAGVVDSGGAGFLCILEGMREAMDSDSTYTVASAKTSVREIEPDDELLGYCTEFILQLMGGQAFSLDEFKAYLNTVGNSIVAFQNDNIVKVHVHTFKPEEVLGRAHGYGEFLTVKVENMTVMHSETTVENDEEKRFMNYQNYGGSVMLGTEKIIIKGHGSSDAAAVYKCIKQAV